MSSDLSRIFNNVVASYLGGADQTQKANKSIPGSLARLNSTSLKDMHAARAALGETFVSRDGKMAIPIHQVDFGKALGQATRITAA